MTPPTSTPPPDVDPPPLVEIVEAPPAIAPTTRTRVYVGCVVVDVLAVLGFGLAAIFGWLPGAQAAAALTLALAAVNGLAAGLGVAYRPTRPGALHAAAIAQPADVGALVAGVIAQLAARTGSSGGAPTRAALFDRFRRRP